MPGEFTEKGKWTWARWGDFNNLSDLLDLLGWKTQAVSVLISLVSFSWLWEPGQRPTAVIAIALSVIAISAFSIAWQKRFAPHRSDKGAKATGAIEFFPTVDDLRTKHPLPETFKAGNEIHAYFLSGEGVFAEHNDYIKCVRRLMLPRPDTENIATLNAFSSTYIDYRSQIPKYMDLARKNNVPVRLFQSFTGVSLLFCNPDRRDGWVQIGPIIPGSESSDRHHYRIYKATNETPFCALYKVFDRLWEASDAAAEDSKSSLAGEFVSMKDAAVKFYAEARNSKFIMAQAAEEMSGRNISHGSPEEILQYTATYISKKIPVYGKKAPSNVRERISSDNLPAYAFKQEATRLEHLFYHTSADSVFTDIEVRRDQLEALIEQMHFDSGFHDAQS